MAKLQIIANNTKAKDSGSELVVFPELALTGHLNKNKSAINSNNSEILELADYANKNDLYISCGFAEKYNKEFYNSSVLVGPEGIIGVYRKIHWKNAKLFTYI